MSLASLPPNLMALQHTGRLMESGTTRSRMYAVRCAARAHIPVLRALRKADRFDALRLLLAIG
jgi:hypothetical protein